MENLTNEEIDNVLSLEEDVLNNDITEQEDREIEEAVDQLLSKNIDKEETNKTDPIKLEKSEEPEDYDYIIDGVGYKVVDSKKIKETKEDTKEESYVEVLKSPEVPVGALTVTNSGPYKVKSIVAGSYIPNKDTDTITNVEKIPDTNIGSIYLYGYFLKGNTYPEEGYEEKTLVAENGDKKTIKLPTEIDWKTNAGKFILPYIPSNKDIEALSIYDTYLNFFMKASKEDQKAASNLMIDILNVMLNYNMVPIDLLQDVPGDMKAIKPLTMVETLVRCFTSIYGGMGVSLSGECAVIGDPEGFWLNDRKVSTTYYYTSLKEFYEIGGKDNIMIIMPLKSSKPDSNGKLPIDKLKITFASKNSDKVICLLVEFSKDHSELNDFEMF